MLRTSSSDRVLAVLLSALQVDTYQQVCDTISTCVAAEASDKVQKRAEMDNSIDMVNSFPWQ